MMVSFQGVLDAAIEEMELPGISQARHRELREVIREGNWLSARADKLRLPMYELAGQG